MNAIDMKTDFLPAVNRVFNGVGTKNDELTADRYINRVRASLRGLRDPKRSNEFGCHLSAKAFHDKKNLHKRFKVADNGGNRTEIYFQQGAVIASMSVLDLKSAKAEGRATILDTVEFTDKDFHRTKADITHECAHDCHVGECGNPAHVTVRPRQENKDQNFCRAFMMDGVKFTTCCHTPQCMLVAVPIQRYSGGAPAVVQNPGAAPAV